MTTVGLPAPPSPGSTSPTSTLGLPEPPLTRSPARLTLAPWSHYLGTPGPESVRSRRLAHLGGLTATLALVGYLVWRVTATLPQSGPWRAAAWLLVAFEALPLLTSVVKLVSWWNIDTVPVDAAPAAPHGMRVAVLIPTYNEPAEVVGPTIAAARALQPAHETWVLDDGDRPWLADLCRAYDVRYVTRPEHEHAKAGNLNNALAVMAREEVTGVAPIDLIAVLDCDHVPLPGFLPVLLGYFEDEDVALVQAPQSFFNTGAFDDDGYTGEQGLFFNVQLAARQHSGAGTFWCGSSSLLRVAALRDVGGVAQETVTEDMHTTLKLQRRGWRTVYHHQTVALGLAPETPEQYLVQRRRWGMGAMQVLVHEKLWRRQRYLTWRTQFEYLVGALWWLEGLATILALVIPAVLLVTGASTSTVAPQTFLVVFVVAFSLRMWGYKLLLRRQIRWRTAFALRVLRVPIGLACLWWLVSRRNLQFTVTPKGASHLRARGRIPAAVVLLVVVTLALVGYSVLGTQHLVPWRTDASSTATSGVWIVAGLVVLAHAVRRIRAERYATTRRSAHRFPTGGEVRVDGVVGDLVDVSVNGAAVRFAPGDGVLPGPAEVTLPGAGSMHMMVSSPSGDDLVKLSLPAGDWAALRTMSLWLFHTPAGAVDGLPDGVPVVAVTAA